MVSLKIQLLATIFLISEGYSQVATSCARGYNQRCGPATVPQQGPFIPACQFCVPAVIKPCLSPCQTRKSASVAPCSSPCADVDDESDLDSVIYALLCNILDSRKCSGRRSGYNPSYNYDLNLDSSDCYVPRLSGYDSRSPGYESRSPYYESRSPGYEPRSPCYCEDYDYAQPSPYSPPPTPYCSCTAGEPYTVTTSCDTTNNCPEICVLFRPRQACQDSACD